MGISNKDMPIKLKGTNGIWELITVKNYKAFHCKPSTYIISHNR